MQNDRCPKCAATVRKDADWCTLCYADLRPAPTPPPRTAPVAHVAAPAPAYAPTGSDLLDAAHELVAASVGGADSAPSLPVDSGRPAAAGKLVGWPCTACGEINAFEVAACGVCGAPFGGLLRSTSSGVDRKRLNTMVAAAVAAVLLVFAALTYMTTKSPAGGGGDPAPVQEIVPGDGSGEQEPAPAEGVAAV